MSLWASQNDLLFGVDVVGVENVTMMQEFALPFPIPEKNPENPGSEYLDEYLDDYINYHKDGSTDKLKVLWAGVSFNDGGLMTNLSDYKITNGGQR